MKTLIVFLFFSINLLSQSFSLEYDYLVRLKNGNTTERILNIKGNDSFIIQEKIKNPTNFKEDTIYEKNSSMKRIRVNSGNKKIIRHWLFKDIKKNVLKEQSTDYKSTILDSVSFLKWEFTGNNKIINEFNCQEAKTEFRGRTYNAWFTTSYPINYGPWKLDGLPGLIIEASSDDGIFKWILRKIENTTNEEVTNLNEKENDIFSNSYLSPKEYFNNTIIEALKKSEIEKKYFISKYGGIEGYKKTLIILEIFDLKYKNEAGYTVL